MATTKKPTGKIITDIAHPGKTAPSGNSKSVIITKRPVIQDPMVTADAPAPAVASSPSTKKKIILPLSAPTEPEPKEEVVETAPMPPEEPTPKPPEKAPSTEPVASTLEPKPVATFADGGDKGLVNGEAQESIDEAADKKHHQAVQKLIDSKQYYLPIESSEQRRTKRTVVIGLLVSVILAAAWFDVALDSGIITIDGVQSLTHFFS